MIPNIMYNKKSCYVDFKCSQKVRPKNPTIGGRYNLKVGVMAFSVIKTLDCNYKNVVSHRRLKCFCKIKNKKKLYVRAKAVKVVGKKSYTGKWSKAKKVKVK